MKAIVCKSWNLLYLFKKHRKTNLKVFQNQILTSVKRSEKQLDFSTFSNLVALILDQNCVKGLRVTNIVKEIKFEKV